VPPQAGAAVRGADQRGWTAGVPLPRWVGVGVCGGGGGGGGGGGVLPVGSAATGWSTIWSQQVLQKVTLRNHPHHHATQHQPTSPAHTPLTKGWEFSGQGTCERIPQGADASNPRACATAFPCAVRQGLLFVRPKPVTGASPADESTIPIVDELEDPEWVTQVGGWVRGWMDGWVLSS